VVHQPTSAKTAADLIRIATLELAESGIETARIDAEVLLRRTLGVDRTRLFMRLRDSVDTVAAARFQSLVERRVSGEPVAYLIGIKEFMGIEFAVGSGVLIPRPETELMVEWAVRWLSGKTHASVVDVGTGSGAIILSLAILLAGNQSGLLIGCDRSGTALKFAIRNRAALGMENTVQLVRGDLITWLGVSTNLILANLPYLTPEQVASNPDLQAEPEVALVSGPGGLDAIERLLADIPRVLSPHGAVAMELDPSQAEHIADVARGALPGAKVSIVRDYAGTDRFVIAECD
jgi:release factor glutamine methyltransferase